MKNEEQFFRLIKAFELYLVEFKENITIKTKNHFSNYQSRNNKYMFLLNYNICKV